MSALIEKIKNKNMEQNIQPMIWELMREMKQERGQSMLSTGRFSGFT